MVPQKMVFARNMVPQLWCLLRIQNCTVCQEDKVFLFIDKILATVFHKTQVTFDMGGLFKGHSCPGALLQVILYKDDLLKGNLDKCGFDTGHYCIDKVAM